MANGKFIVLEGLDGAGTTTQLDRLAARVRALGGPVLTTREPSDGPLGHMLRQALAGRLVLPAGRGPLSAETLALMFAADRVDHLHAQVRPALAAGTVVICDRYVLSSLAYQGASVAMEWVNELNRAALSPDLTLFLEVDVDTAARRRAIRGTPSELYEEDDLQRRIAAQYRKAIRLREQEEKIVRVAGVEGIDAVTDACWVHVEALLKKGGKR
ncbi:MAG: thymidylate kinase [Pseudomonadota bacterium]